MTSTPDNSLGLQLEQLQIADAEPAQSSPLNVSASNEPVPGEPPSNSHSKEKKKEKPYINPERFKTGGSQREKLSDEELAERMQRMKAQNERIKQRRLDVVADEEAFRKTEQEEHARLVRTREAQEKVNRAREQNARRKLDKIQGREWDSGKPTSSSDNAAARETNDAGVAPVSPSHSTGEGHWRRGGSRGRPRRGLRGRGWGRDGGMEHGGANTTPSHSGTQASLEVQPKSPGAET
ncbi:hypothetical protein AX15_006125 [Amanita polypyramis BW_CC]|nr:hypothetical protein AX15_006125 [Amanita polypyramis BW_CC]